MRLVMVLAVVLLLAGASYLVVAGYFLAKAASGVLTVGAIASSITLATPPEDPMSLGYRGNPMVALSLPFEVIGIDTPLGVAEAWLVPAAGAERGRAIYVHGIAGTRENGYRHLSILHEAGWSVLLISYRNDPGAPDGPEDRYGFGLLEWPDLEAAVDWYSPGPDGPGLLIVAESMGGAILGQFLLQSPLADRVSSVALDSPALSFSAVTRHLAAQGGKPLPGATAWVAGLILPHLIDLPLDSAEVADAFTTFPGPVFIAHGAGDRIVPIAPSQALATMRQGRTESLFGLADHLGTYGEDATAYRGAFQKFLAGLSG